LLTFLNYGDKTCLVGYKFPSQKTTQATNFIEECRERGRLNKRSFHAGHWFLKESNEPEHSEAKISDEIDQGTAMSETVKNALSPFVPKSDQESDSSLQKYFIPGWKGESLISKEVKKFKELLDEFYKDAKVNFLKRNNFNRKLRISIYEEFISYVEFKTCICSEMDDYTVFWKEIENPDSKYRDLLDEFINIFSFRVSVIYILKIRFISVLMEQTAIDSDPKKLLYPNSFLTNVFQKGGSSELKSKALEQNIYSWYRPSERCQSLLGELQRTSFNLNVTEIIKNISIKSEELLRTNTLYSHALSHKNFGLFLNSLFINFPLWLNTQSNRPFNGFKTSSQDMEVISCKFAGDYLESLALSHWLAQEANKKEKWDQILCPDFKRNDFEAGQYWKIVNELQFLTFLAQIARDKGKEPVTFVSQVAGGHLRNRKNSSVGQKSLMINDISLNHSTYDRITLNLTEYPKNNSQHFLLGKIQEQSTFLKEDGFLFVISSKKLFVPSQKNKVEGLLKQFRVEGIFNLEEVKGKGEVGSYIYIFSKQSTTFTNPKKQTCFTFRLSANLDTFQHYSQLTKLIQDFFIANLGDAPALYQKSFHEAKFEFFQDAIVNGRLIHSSSKDANKITHPQFFNNLLKNCMPLDFFFDIQNIDFNNSYRDEDPLFEYSHANSANLAPFVIIVDQRRKEKVRLEIILSSSLEVKSYEYGHSMCFYFGAYPKWPKLSIDAVRDFFDSPIGEQIIDLTFTSELKKVKASLNKLLLPKFFYQYKDLPDHIASGLSLLSADSDDILEMRPSLVQEQFSSIEKFLGEVAKNYPCAALDKLSGFKRMITRALDTLGNSETHKAINFNNPILKTPLVLSKTYSIYPENEDIFVNFDNEGPMNLIHSPLQKTKKKVEVHEGLESTCLKLFVQDHPIITLYSDEEMIAFLQFILENLKGIPVSQILQGVSAPRLDDLKSIIAGFNSLRQTLEETREKIPRLYSTLINQSIARG